LAGLSILTYPLSLREANLVFEFRESVEASLAVPLFDRDLFSSKLLEAPLLANLGLTLVFEVFVFVELELFGLDLLYDVRIMSFGFLIFEMNC
jgi:hypothetical protein